MVITVDAQEVKDYMQVIADANKDCDICPCCGEKERCIYDGQRNFAKGFFRQTEYRVDRYKCYSCGAKWESDPYIYKPHIYKRF